MNIRIASACLLVAAAGCTTNVAAQTSTFVGLGSAASTASRISNDGRVVTGETGGMAWRWTAVSGIESIGSLPGAVENIPNCIDGNGRTIAGRSELIRGDGESYRPFVWRQGLGIQELPLPAGAIFGYALGMSANSNKICGHVVFRVIPTNEEHGYIWDNGIPTFDLGYRRWPAAICNSGERVVGFDYAGTEARAFSWTQETGVVLLNMPAGVTTSDAHNISGDCNWIVGWYGNPATGRQAPFRWSESTGLQDLGPLPGSESGFSIATASNQDGSVIVGSASSPAGSNKATVWTAALGTVRVEDLLIADGVLPPGWDLYTAQDVSGDGRTIVGIGRHNGVTEGWVAYIPSLIPCRPDLNGDGLVTSQDFFAFIGDFFSGRPEADYNNDGAVTSQDFFDFISQFFEGCG